jgi:hypothetical protein
LRMMWVEADHPSGVYYAKSDGKFTIAVENPTADPLLLKGTVAFGTRGETAADFKALSLTPITGTTLAPGQRATLSIAVAFAATGAYELRWIDGADSTTIENSAGVKLECIFAPRTGGGETPWLTVLPKQAALVSGYLTDLATQTTVRRYLLDERFAFDVAHNVGLAAGAGLGVSTEQVDSLFVEAMKAKAGIVLRVSVPVGDANPQLVAAFHQYIEDAVRRGGAITGIAIVPEGGSASAWTAQERAVYRCFYLAGYEAAKGRDKGILLLGAGAAEATRDLLAGNGEDDLRVYVDAIAVTDASRQPAIAAQISKAPVWVLPPRVADPWALGAAAPAAVALGEGAAIAAVPPPGIDHGATEHLLGGAVMFQKLQPGAGWTLPYVVAFQGDGYSIAAVAGLSAGTPLDAMYPGLASTRTVVAPATEDDKPPYPNLEVEDEPGSMRAVDAAGAPIDCRDGDTLYVPAADHVAYVLAGGSAEDMMSLLRVATPNRLPVMEVSATATSGALVTVRLMNISTNEVGGTVRLLTPANAGRERTILAEKDFMPIAVGKALEVPMELTAELPKEGMLVAEIITAEKNGGMVQRTAIAIGSKPESR